jgi:VIT1/CCC1 family predicted Fe2+/Mn2+ transporter
MLTEKDPLVNLPTWPSMISMSVVPVVIISACGLLSLAFYSRLAAVVSRLRAFQREMLIEQEKMERAGGSDPSGLIEVLRTQTQQVTRRARLIRTALLFFLTAVALLIVCSLTLVASWFAPAAAFLAAVLFVLGLFAMLAGIIAAMLELRGALQPVELETRFVSSTIDPAYSEGLQETEPLLPEDQPSDSSHFRR